MAKSKKYYVVWHGNQPGIYDSWSDCLAQVKNFPNAKYKAFPSKSQAEEAYLGAYEERPQLRKSKVSQGNWQNEIKPGSVVVDAACSGNPGDLEYQGVNPFSGEKLFHVGPLAEGTNNVGEFLAIVHALALLKKAQKDQTAIYSDSKIAINWVKLKHPNTKLVFSSRNQILYDLIQRAIKWLNENKYNNPILKWKTEQWGENPADFGRK